METLQTLSVLHVIAPATYGGMESVVARLATGLAMRGHSVRVAAVLSPGSDPHPFAAALATNDVKVIELRIGDRSYLAEQRAIRGMCLQSRTDVVHTHGFRPDVVDGLVARSLRIPVISTCHGFVDSSWRGRVYQRLQRMALRHFDAVVAVSTGISSILRASGVPQKKIHLVLNATAQTDGLLSRADARRLLDVPDPPVIGWVGRLSAEKGPDIALEAFARLDNRDARLLMVGEGREQTALRALGEALGISNRILWRGAVPDAGRFFPGFDAFLLSSRTEGTPIALLEAMAAGVPVVATSVGGVPNVIDGSSAWLVPSLNPEAIAGALGELLSNPRLARERADRARGTIRARFAFDPWLSQYESVYHAALNSKKRKLPSGRAQS